VDGNRFVADSQWEKMEEKRRELQKSQRQPRAEEHGAREGVASVLEYNSAAIPEHRAGQLMESFLNNRKKKTGCKACEVISSTGTELFATLNASRRS